MFYCRKVGCSFLDKQLNGLANFTRIKMQGDFCFHDGDLLISFQLKFRVIKNKIYIF
jgi:hypothetical protein